MVIVYNKKKKKKRIGFKEEDRISKLPQELIELIFNELPVQDAARTIILSKTWRLPWPLLCKRIVKNLLYNKRSSFPTTCAEEDRISKLPQQLIDFILDKLPVQDAARTSILSKTWRYRWTSMNALVFSKRRFSHLKMLQTQASASAAFAHNIDDVYNNGYFLKFFIAETLPKWPPHAFARLKRLDLLDIDFADLDQLHGVLCILRNTPNLERLCVRNEHMMMMMMMGCQEEEEAALSCCLQPSHLTFSRLQVVTFIHVEATAPEMLFIKLLLNHSPTLEKFIIHARPTHDEAKHISVTEGIGKYRRLSRLARIFYLEPGDDLMARLSYFNKKKQLNLRNLVNSNGSGDHLHL